MDDVRTQVRRELERLQPSPDGLEKTLRRVRRRERNRKVGAGAIGLVLTSGLALGLWASLRPDRPIPPIGPVSPSPGQTSVGAQLFLAGDGEMWVVDVSTDDVRRLDMPELSPGDAPHRIVRRDGKLVAWGYETLVIDPDRPSHPEVLADDSWIFIPSSEEDRVWVGVLDPESPETVRPLGAVREVSVDGEVTFADTRPPGGRWPIAAVEEGLVFEMGREHEALEVWDPRSGDIIRRLPGAFPLSWQGHLLVWCDAECDEVHITDFSTGADRIIQLPLGILSAEGAALSPDGTLLALIGLTDHRSDRADRQLVLVDVATGEAEPVEGTSVRPYYNFVDWSASGDSVFITGGARFEHRQIIEYRPAEGTVRTLPVEVGDFYDMAAL
jgi:hypothetical protein